MGQAIIINNLKSLRKASLEALQPDPEWSIPDRPDDAMHKIHAYPAKFPSFIARKAIERYGTHLDVNSVIGDFFCGCGTVGLESKRAGIHFWGCDINPVASLIARVKSMSYSADRIESYRNAILANIKLVEPLAEFDPVAKERLSYWFRSEDMITLGRLMASILESVPKRSKYRNLFLVAFSNILKATSRWLTKSIKPQIDPKKAPIDVIEAFSTQVSRIKKACADTSSEHKSGCKIVTKSVLDAERNSPPLDLLITSPPYVTSYEYADLHQLSALWLGYASDYRELRESSIGSSQATRAFRYTIKKLNEEGQNIALSLYGKDKGIATKVAQYFDDMQQVAIKSYQQLKPGGAAVFVIGDTSYLGTEVRNSRHLVESLLNSGFNQIRVSKRKVTGKTLTPYRDASGRFSASSNNRKVYSHEYVVQAIK